MRNIKAALLVVASLIVNYTLLAQPIYRTEISPFTERRDASKGIHSTESLYLKFNPTLISEQVGNRLYSYNFTHPAQWSDGRITLHLESLPSAAYLIINGVEIAPINDSFTPTDIDITRYVHQSENVIEIVILKGNTSPLEQALNRPSREAFTNSYISFQSALHIEDFTLSMHHDHQENHAYLTLEVIVKNLYPQPREIEIGFDIYNPVGELIEYDFRKREVAAGGRDTISLSRPIWGAGSYKWGVENSALRKGVGQLSSPLYSVMLYTRLGGVLREYIPFKVGYTDFKVEDGVLSSFGNKLNICPREVGAIDSPEECKKLLTTLKGEGVNMLLITHAQPSYFYQTADAMGMLVVDAVSINAPKSSDNRAVGGSVANDPSLIDDFISRGKSSYYRSRNHTSVVAYSLGGDSGNGYNMYRLYELLRQAEPSRPIIYQGAKGEWNSDKLNF